MILETMFSKCFGSSDVSRDHFWHLRSHVGASGMPCKAPQQEQKCLRGVRLAVSRPSAPKMGTKINPRMRKTNMKKRLRMRLGKGLQKSVQRIKNGSAPTIIIEFPLVWELNFHFFSLTPKSRQNGAPAGASGLKNRSTRLSRGVPKNLEKTTLYQGECFTV